MMHPYRIVIAPVAEPKEPVHLVRDVACIFGSLWIEILLASIVSILAAPVILLVILVSLFTDRWRP